MKKRLCFAAMMMGMAICAAASNSWRTTASKYPTDSWLNAKFQAMSKLSKYPKLPIWSEGTVSSWPEPVNSWPES